jgi:FKBP-type peptidyl-prolyl cis-trans isomerase
LGHFDTLLGYFWLKALKIDFRGAQGLPCGINTLYYKKSLFWLPGSIFRNFDVWMAIMQKISKFSVVLVPAVLFLSLAVLLACKGKEGDNPDALDSDSSYAFGMLMSNQLKGQFGFVGLSFDYKAFAEGFKDFNEEKETRITQEKAIELINAAFTQLQAREDEKTWLEGTKNREEGEAYLAANAARSGVITTASGLQYEVVKQGSGAKPGPDDSVRVHYEGTLIDGTVFDSSYARSQPAEFTVDAVIPGWVEGLQLMNEGSTYRFVIPSDLAYGPNGSGRIPPSATLVFTVELLSVIKQE